jgi:hypothetical protein
MRNNHYANVAIASLCLIISGWALAKSNVLGFLQDPERVILQARPNKKDPLEITEIKVKEKAIRFEEKFTEDGQWLRDATFKIRNKYSKPITYVHIDIDFPETEATGIMMQRQLFLGQHPAPKRPSPRPPVRILPGESLEVSLASEFDGIKRMIERRNPSINNISQILIRLNEVAFEDGTLYSGGNIYRLNPDPNGPKWLKVVE